MSNQNRAWRLTLRRPMPVSDVTSALIFPQAPTRSSNARRRNSHNSRWSSQACQRQGGHRPAGHSLPQFLFRSIRRGRRLWTQISVALVFRHIHARGFRELRNRVRVDHHFSEAGQEWGSGQQGAVVEVYLGWFNWVADSACVRRGPARGGGFGTLLAPCVGIRPRGLKMVDEARPSTKKLSVEAMLAPPQPATERRGRRNG